MAGVSARRYAQALFELSEENKIDFEIEKQVSELMKLISKNEDFKFLLSGKKINI